MNEEMRKIKDYFKENYWLWSEMGGGVIWANGLEISHARFAEK